MGCPARTLRYRTPPTTYAILNELPDVGYTQRMERSFAQAIDLTCVGCGQTFTSDIWLIVDAAERPDLVARIADESLNVVVCPHCGTPHPVEAPLLFHDRAAQTLIFTPQEHRTTAESQEAAQQLGQFLISRIPVAERQPYLASAHMVSGKEELRRAIAGEAVEDVLSAALRALMDAKSADAIRSVAAAHPILGSDYVRRLRQDQHLETAEALALRLSVLRAERPSPALALIQALLDATSPEERQHILAQRGRDIPGDTPAVLEALAEQAELRQLDAVARDLRVLRTEVLRRLEALP
jgi:hypothetical protein